MGGVAAETAVFVLMQVKCNATDRFSLSMLSRVALCLSERPNRVFRIDEFDLPPPRFHRSAKPGVGRGDCAAE